MPKQGSPDLFLLIKSLNKAEKAYFKRFAELHVIGGQNNYLKLFDAIDRQETYDEKKLLREEKYIRQLPYLKNYLRSSILKAMQSFYAEHTLDHRLRRMMDDAWFLLKKRLYDQCTEVLLKARKLSAETISGYPFIDSLRMQERVFGITCDLKLWEAYLEESEPLERAHLDDSLLYSEINLCNMKLFVYVSKYGANLNEETAAWLYREVGAPLIEREKKAKSFRCLWRLHHTLSSYYGQARQRPEQHRHSKKLVEVFQAFPTFMNEHMGFYSSALSNYGMACVNIGRHKEALGVVREIWKLPIPQPEDKRRLFVGALLLEMLIHFDARSAAEGVKTFRRHHESLSRHFTQDFVDQEVFIYLYAIPLHIYEGKHKDALRLVSEVLAHPHIYRKEWVKILLSLLQIIILHELNHDTSSFIKNLRRRLKTAAEPVKAETVVLDLLEKLPHAENAKARARLAASALQQLQGMPDEPSFITFNGFFKVLTWLECMIGGKSFTERMRMENKM